MSYDVEFKYRMFLIISIILFVSLCISLFANYALASALDQAYIAINEYDALVVDLLDMLENS